MDAWSVVEKVVRERGRELVKYSYFEEVWRALDERELVVVRAPTGCGKTEAAIAPFVLGLVEDDQPFLSLVYSLPTRSLAKAVQKRLARALAAVGVAQATVTLDYGGLDALKPYLEGDIVVTTYDSLLYQFYGVVRPGYHVLLPASKLSASLVLMDEVHLLQDTLWYAPTLLPYHVENLVELGAKVVVMGATIPSVLLSELEERARRRRLAVIDASDRPARGELEVELRDGCLPTGEGLDGLVKQILEEGLLPALLIYNTVEAAVSAYRRLLEMRDEGWLGGVRPILLHSRLRQGCREAVEEMFESREGRFDNAILVATQVVEAGLDLDVRYLATELAPIDSLIQRIGRCARRRGTKGLAVVYREAGRGVPGRVYPEEVLERTKLVLDEGALEESVAKLEAAQSLIDKVYTRDVTQGLRRRAGEQLNRAISWVMKFRKRLFKKLGREEPPPLLRLGVELRCYLPASEEEYAALLERGRLELGSLRELEERCVRISLKDPKGDPPKAVLHAVGGREVVLAAEAAGEPPVLEVRVLDPPRAEGEWVRLASGGRMLVLRPDFYEWYTSKRGERFELGVVSPWGSSGRSA